ncbi:MAG TPA: hypothetical protein VJ652_11920 [Noviherbaspirillum sp.]|nr:hypothetical protein [Noviherbaspirillum sp.]
MLFLKSTASPLAPGIFAVDVAAKPPGKTYMIYAALDADDLPTPFIQAIEGMGFKEVHALHYHHHNGKKIVDLHFQKPGTDIFEGWTNVEREKNLIDIAEALGRFNIKVHPRVMSLAEAFG